MKIMISGKDKNSDPHIRYRESKLTRLLQHSLGKHIFYKIGSIAIVKSRPRPKQTFIPYSDFLLELTSFYDSKRL